MTRSLLVRRSTHAVVLLTAVAAALRFGTLTTKGFWGDEISTVMLVRLPFDRMLSEIARLESTPPLYYAAAWLWTKLFGTGEAGLRSLSALCGTATVPVVYLAARDLLGRRPATLAAALIAVNPLLIWYSQEGRSYAMLVLLSSLGLMWFARALRGDGHGALAGWAVVSCLALLTHYFAGFLVLPEAVLLVRARLPTARVRVALAAVAMACVALAPLAVHQAGFGHAAWIGNSSLAARIASVPGELSFGFELGAPIVLGVLGAVFLGAGGWLAARAPRNAGRPTPGPFALVAAAAIAVPLLLALAGVDYFNARNSIAVVVPVTIAVVGGYCAWRTSLASASVAVMVAISLLVVALTADQPKFHSEDWRDAAQDLGRTSWARAIVATPGQAGRKPLAYYLDGRPASGPSPVRVREVDVVALPLQAHTRLARATRARMSRLRLGGFRVAARHVERDLVIVRFIARSPVDVTPARLDVRVGSRAATVVVSRASAGEFGAEAAHRAL